MTDEQGTAVTERGPGPSVPVVDYRALHSFQRLGDDNVRFDSLLI